MIQTMKKYQKAAALFAVAWMIMIFAFSSQPSEESSEVSGGVTEKIVTTANFLFKLNLDQAKITELVDKWETPVRKTAHATEFFVLTASLFLWMDYLELPIAKQALRTGLGSSIYAASDEFHQLFVPGRAGKISDIGVDCIGVMFALLVFVGVRVCTSSLWKKDKLTKTE